MKRSVILFGLLLALSTTATAAPLISTLSGDFSNQQTVAIHGSAFGSHNLDIEWTGSQIENTQAGAVFSKSGWSGGTDSTSFNAARIDSVDKHSGKKSILCKWEGDPRVYGSVFTFNRGKAIGDTYMTWWIKFKHVGPAGQWKIWRLRPDNKVNDISPEFYQNAWYSSAMKQAYMRPSNTDSEWLSKDAQKSGVLWLNDEDVPKPDEWVRMEYFIKPSGQGKTDGTFTYFIHRPGDTISNPINYRNNLMTYGPNQTKRWQYVVFGQYWGNGGLDAKAWYDDIYMQFGSQARVEIGDKSTWNSCTYREIQVPTSWTSDKITITSNTGSFPAGSSAYLYVVDSNGLVNSNGYKLIIGQSSSTIQKPSTAPTGLRIVNN